MFERMGFYRRMAAKYQIALFRTRASLLPGKVIYEDVFQIAVVESRRSGEGFLTEAVLCPGWSRHQTPRSDFPSRRNRVAAPKPFSVL